MSTTTGKYLDVWLREENLEEGLYEAEANTLLTETGHVVQWYLTSVGLVKSVFFDTLSDAHDWLENEMFVYYGPAVIE